MRIAARIAAEQPYGWYRLFLPLLHLAAAGHDVHAERDHLRVAVRATDPLTWGRVLEHDRRPVRLPGVARTSLEPPEVLVWDSLWHHTHRRELDGIRAAQRAGRRVPRVLVSLGDDFLTDGVGPGVTVRGFDSGDTSRLRAELRANVWHMIGQADAVIVTSDALAAVVAGAAREVHVLGNYLPAAWLEEPPRQHRGSAITVGFTGGREHAANLAAIRPALLEFLGRHRDTRLYLRGWHDQQLLAGVPAERRCAEGWVHNPWENHLANRFDVGVIPLERTAFNASRTDLKFHEYALRGVATVASDWGPYAAGIEHGRTGLLASDPAQWLEHLEALRDPDRRGELAAAARHAVASRTIEGQLWRWERALAPGHVAGPCGPPHSVVKGGRPRRGRDLATAPQVTGG